MKVYIGIDWSENKHAVCFLNEKGEVTRVQEIAHTLSGFRQLDQARQSLGVGRQEVILGLETAHNLLVDYLWDQGYEQIYVLPPKAVKSAQTRFRQSGAKDDAWDAHLIADLLRTDRHRYSPWKPDLPLTRQIRAEVRFAQQLGREAVQNQNRLRALLLRYGALGVGVDSLFDEEFPVGQGLDRRALPPRASPLDRHHGAPPAEEGRPQ